MAALGRAGRAGRDRAEVHRAIDAASTGAYGKARKILRRVAGRHPSWLDLQVRFGALLLETGREQKARAVLDRLADLHDAGRISTAADMLALGEAMALLDHPRDANDVFREAARQDPGSASILIAWGRLLARKHNPEEALQSYDAALRVWPGHPIALVGKAEILFEASGDAHGARDLLLHALAQSPKLREGRLLEARIALFLEDLPAAERTIRDLLARNPRDREALALLGAVAFLRGDTRRLEVLWRRSAAVHRRDARFWHRIAFFAERFHRYAQIVPLLERALRLDPDYAPALVDLGIAYSRIGDDGRARIYLNKAREEDPFDRRAFYMTERLYETILKDYRSEERDGVRYRIERSERGVLLGILPPWVDDARKRYRKRYGFTLEAPIQVEVFREVETFGVRTVGQPRFWAHGVCFGHVLAMRSPRSGDFNLREVVLHELAHAYHLQETGGRVPRWLTEGLAELEAMRIDPSLQREIEPAMAERLRGRRMTPICRLSEAFVRARTGADMMDAYMQARLVAEWLDHRMGSAGIRKLLAGLARGADVDVAFREALGLACGPAHQAFLGWARTRLGPFLPPHPFIPDRLPPAAVLRARIKRGDDRAGVLLADRLLRARRTQAAEATLGLVRETGRPDGRLVEARVRRAQGDLAAAANLLDGLVAGGHDGQQVSAERAQIHMDSGEWRSAERLLRRALEQAPPDSDTLKLLEGVLDKIGKGDSAREIRLRRALVDEHDGALREAILREAVGRRAWKEARAALHLALEVRPLSASTWTLAGLLAYGARRDCKEALRAFDRARALGGQASEEAILDEAECRIERGQPKRARRLLRRIMATDPQHPRLPALRARIKARSSGR